jgi:hypothetical protein
LGNSVMKAVLLQAGMGKAMTLTRSPSSAVLGMVLAEGEAGAVVVINPAQALAVIVSAPGAGIKNRTLLVNVALTKPVLNVGQR